jgi:hypothetical protein
MLDELVAKLRDFRKVWWEGKKTTCLENKWMVRIAPGRLAVLNERRSGTKGVRSAYHEVISGMTTVTFADGTEECIASGDAE